MSTTGDISLAKGVTATTSNATTSTPPAAGGGEGAEETKTVQTVDYRESAGQGQHTIPVEVVHVISPKEGDQKHAGKLD